MYYNYGDKYKARILCAWSDECHKRASDERDKAVAGRDSEGGAA